MKKKFFVGMSLLMFFVSIFAKIPPAGWNYINNGHLCVWYQNAYLDMGSYTP